MGKPKQPILAESALGVLGEQIGIGKRRLLVVMLAGQGTRQQQPGGGGGFGVAGQRGARRLFGRRIVMPCQRRLALGKAEMRRTRWLPRGGPRGGRAAGRARFSGLVAAGRGAGWGGATFQLLHPECQVRDLLGQVRLHLSLGVAQIVDLAVQIADLVLQAEYVIIEIGGHVSAGWRGRWRRGIGAAEAGLIMVTMRAGDLLAQLIEVVAQFEHLILQRDILARHGLGMGRDAAEHDREAGTGKKVTAAGKGHGMVARHSSAQHRMGIGQREISL